MTNQTIMRAADFVNSLGVEAQINYTDGAYHNIGNVLNDLKYLGINLIRSASLNSAGAAGGQNDYKIAAAAGIRFDLVADGNLPLASTVSQIDKFAKTYPGAVYAVEGPNEIDHNPISYDGLTGPAAAIKFQNDLYSQLIGDPAIRGASIYSFSLGSGATPTGGYTQVALHPYPAGGAEPLATLDKALALAPAGAASVLSETGYSTDPKNNSGVDQLTQAKLTLNMIFDAFAAGVDTVYLYGLLDAYADPTGTTLSDHYGLFDLNNNPKTLATAVHNLLNIISDTGQASKSFTVEPLSYSISNATASSFTLEKSNGTYDIAVWAEPKIWSSKEHAEIAAPSISEVIDFGQVVGDIKIFDPLSGTSPLMEEQNVSSITVSVTDHPVIVQVSGLSPGQDIKNDTMIGGTNESLYGGAGIDTFVFHKGFGHDNVFNFTTSGINSDVIQLDRSVFSDWAHVLGATKQKGSDLTITLDPTDVLSLKNVALANFTQSDVKLV